MKLPLCLLLLLVPVAHCSLQDVCCKDGVPVTTLLKEPACAAIIGTAGLASLAAAPFALAAAGFGSIGIAGGSLAAWWQSTGYLAGTFAGLQSAGMAGVALGTKASIAAAASAGAAKLCCAAVTCQTKLDW